MFVGVVHLGADLRPAGMAARPLNPEPVPSFSYIHSVAKLTQSGFFFLLTSTGCLRREVQHYPASALKRR